MRPTVLLLCGVLLTATLLFAGCTSQSPDTSAAPVSTTSAPEQQYTQAAGTPEMTQTVAAMPTDVQADNVGDSSDAAVANEDSLVDQYNSTDQPLTMTPDSADIGSPIP